MLNFENYTLLLDAPHQKVGLTRKLVPSVIHLIMDHILIKRITTSFHVNVTQNYACSPQFQVGNHEVLEKARWDLIH